MPMMKGHSKEVVGKNISEMIKAGHPPKQAIAASLASARKYKKMAEGGMMEDDETDLGKENYDYSMGEITRLSQSGQAHPAEVANPGEQDEDRMFVDALRRKTEDELGDYDHYAMGGLVEGEKDGPEGTMPSEDMSDSTEDSMERMPKLPAKEEYPMSSLSPEAKEAIEAKKRKRRLMMR